MRRQTHVAGERLFVDYAGTTLEVIDGATQLDYGGISRHGVSLLPGGSGGLSPASIRRLSQTVVTQIQP